ncbi:hypothetical protein ACFSKL_15880 [Belliella marina]|uniref:Uncharacterized protein n=1 Tax=Belliella marina TaxID=1644146 RepID=A0ABW4VSK2_9BACT
MFIFLQMINIGWRSFCILINDYPFVLDVICGFGMMEKYKYFGLYTEAIPNLGGF